MSIRLKVIIMFSLFSPNQVVVVVSENNTNGWYNECTCQVSCWKIQQFQVESETEENSLTMPWKLLGKTLDWTAFRQHKKMNNNLVNAFLKYILCISMWIRNYCCKYRLCDIEQFINIMKQNVAIINALSLFNIGMIFPRYIF